MRIAMLTSLFLPSIGGVEAHIYNICKCLQEQGNHIIILHTILTDDHDTGVVKEKIEDLTVYRIYIHAKKDLDIPGLRSFSYLHGFLRKVQPIFHTNDIYRIVKSICQDEKIDLIHQHDFTSNIFTTKKLSKDWPVVLTNHTGEYLLMMRHGLTRKVLAFFLQHFSYMIGPSAELCDVSFMNKPISVQYIANGVDPQLFRVVSNDEKMRLREQYGLPTDKKIVLCARRWAPTKGVIYLVKAIPFIVREYKDVCFVISGNDYPGYPQYVASINAYIQEQNLEPYIRLVGDIPHQQMENYDQMADIVTLPSLLEATSLSGLEAMSCAKPLVASNIGGIPEIVDDGKTGLLVPAENERELAKAILQLLQDDERCEQMGEQARYRVETEFAWSVCSRKVEKIYNTVLEGYQKC